MLYIPFKDLPKTPNTTRKQRQKIFCSNTVSFFVHTPLFTESLISLLKISLNFDKALIKQT